VTRLLALCAVVVLTACGSSTSESNPPLHVTDSAARLTSLLQQHGVDLIVVRGQRPAPLGRAWQAFEQFAALDVAGGDVEDDAFLFEAGVFDSGTKWGRTFMLDFVRQYGMKDGDIQQVHLTAHFPAKVFDELRSQIRVVSCGEKFSPTPVPDCDGNCSYVGQDALKHLLGSPCRIVPATMAGRAGRTLSDLSVWSYQTGGGSTGEQHASWLSSVDASLVLQHALLSRRLLGYEVYQGSAE